MDEVESEPGLFRSSILKELWVKGRVLSQSRLVLACIDYEVLVVGRSHNQLKCSNQLVLSWQSLHLNWPSPALHMCVCSGTTHVHINEHKSGLPRGPKVARLGHNEVTQVLTQYFVKHEGNVHYLLPSPLSSSELNRKRRRWIFRERDDHNAWFRPQATALNKVTPSHHQVHLVLVAKLKDMPLISFSAVVEARMVEEEKQRHDTNPRDDQVRPAKTRLTCIILIG